MAGVKFSYEIKGVKGSEECFTLAALELLLEEIKTCEEITEKKAKIKIELCK